MKELTLTPEQSTLILSSSDDITLRAPNGDYLGTINSRELAVIAESMPSVLCIKGLFVLGGGRVLVRAAFWGAGASVNRGFHSFDKALMRLLSFIYLGATPSICV